MSQVLEEFGTTAQHRTLEEFADYVEQHKDSYPDIYVILAQRNKVLTISGGDVFQTRWRAGTLRQVDWPDVVPPQIRTRKTSPDWLSAQSKASRPGLT